MCVCVTETKDKMGWKKDLLQVAESLHNGSKSVGGGQWKLSDMTIGLTYLAEERRVQDSKDPSAKIRSLREHSSKQADSTPSMSRLQTFEWACDLADIAYCKSEDDMRIQLRECHDLTLVHGETSSKFLVPAHYWCYNKQEKICVVSVRGTVSKKDMLTDLDSKPEDFEDDTNSEIVHKVHRGMMKSARALFDKLNKQIIDLAAENFRIVLVGHSLGAGTASLLSILLRKSPEMRNYLNQLTCYAIACPAVTSLELAVECQTYINTLVCNDDIVCRMSVSNMSRLNQELLSLNWVSLAKQDIKESKAGAMANYLGVKLGETVSSGGRMVSNTKKLSQVTDYSKKASGKLVSGTKSLTSFATGKMSKMKIGLQRRLTNNEDGEREEAQVSGNDDHMTNDVNDHENPSGEEDVHLLPPGKIILIQSSSNDKHKNQNVEVEAYEVGQDFEGLHRIELTDCMIKDHFLTSYFDSLKLAMNQPMEEAQLVFANVMPKLEGGKKALVGLAEWKEREIKLLKLRRSFQVLYLSGNKNKEKLIDLKGAKVSRIKVTQRPYAIAIEGPDDTVKLDCSDEQIMNQWLTELGKLIVVCK